MSFRLLLTLCCILVGAADADAQEKWFASRLDGGPLPPEIVEEVREKAPGGMPDGLVETSGGGGDIRSAWYGGPTTRYQHGVIGDTVEASTLFVKTATGATVSFDLPVSEVFEDRYPRLADLDGDGKIEVITIRSSTALGASVTVYSLDGNTLVDWANTGFVGRPNRWLNIAGIAPFRGGPQREIAFVETPHIGGTLYVYAFADGRLKGVGELDGFSNHEIGTRELRLSAVADVNGDGRQDLALPSDDRRSLRIVGFVAGQFAELGSARLPSPIDKAIAVDHSGSTPRFIVGLANGAVYQVQRNRP
jgi:hypothetical protein